MHLRLLQFYVCTLRFQGHLLSVKEHDRNNLFLILKRKERQNYLLCQVEVELFEAEKDEELTFLGDCDPCCKLTFWKLVIFSSLC